MKLLSIDLADIRRFTTPVRIAGLGPGLNVLSAPNESGKSTLFDALQALFFQPHRSRGKEIMALKPHAGGAPTVAVEIDLPEGRHRIEKRWLSKPTATIHRNGTLIAQADEAEAFLTRLLQSDTDGGPAGLLWVRQGLTRLEGDTPRERETAKEARRSLLTSVAGEVEALTGGRRMDRAIARTREDLARYLTATGRPAAGGPLARALAEVESLATRHADLQATAARLDQALARRRDVLRLLADLMDPEAAATRQTRLDDATRRLEDARRHADTLAAAATALKGAEAQLHALTDRQTALRRALKDHAEAQARQSATRIAAETAHHAAAQAESDLAPLAAALAQAQSARTEADTRLATALRAEAAQAAAARRADLTHRLAEAGALLARRARLATAAATGPTAQDIATLDTLLQEAQVQRSLRDRSAPQITFHHDGPARVTRDGTDLPDATPLSVHAETRFTMPGLGTFTLAPGLAADHSALDRAEAALVTALARLGQPDAPAARRSAQARAAATADLADLDRALKSLAPSGIAALEADLAGLPPETAPVHDLPTAAQAQTHADAAALALTQAQAAHDAARSHALALRETDIRATEQAKAAESALQQAADAIAPFGDTDKADSDLAANLAAARATLEQARHSHDSLRDNAPDLAAAEAALTRARSIVDAARADLLALETERARLDTDITHHSGTAVMEELADTTARLAAARDTLGHLQFEVSVLQTLAAELDAARDQARDRYFAPVLAELRPLLRLIWPESELRFDGESLLPTALIRNGQEEDLATLSGGTQEQIALLVRLAFARLLARRGQHAPVILDDALVFTDDDRIERMFDALHTQAQDQQILVLSCRQRAFRDLGGTTLTFQPA